METLRPSAIFPEVVLTLKEGDTLNLWTKPGLDIINAYAPGTVGGQGLAFQFAKAENPVLSACIQRGQPTWIEVKAVNGGKCAIESISRTLDDETARLKAIRAAREVLFKTPLTVVKPIKVVISSRLPMKLQRGWVLPFVDEAMDHYVRQDEVQPEFLVPSLFRVATIIKPQTACAKVVQAHFSGYGIRLEITGDPSIGYTGNAYAYWEEQTAPALLTFIPQPLIDSAPQE